MSEDIREFVAGEKTTASNSTRVKPPSFVLRSSSIRHENQENTFLPFFLHASVTTLASARSTSLFGGTHRDL